MQLGSILSILVSSTAIFKLAGRFKRLDILKPKVFNIMDLTQGVIES